MKEWNRNDWQGRSEENVKFSYMAVAYTLAAGIVIAAIAGVYILITMIYYLRETK